MRAYELYEKLDVASGVLNDDGGDGRLSLRNLNRLKRFLRIRAKERRRKLHTVRNMYGNDAIHNLEIDVDGNQIETSLADLNDPIQPIDI